MFVFKSGVVDSEDTYRTQPENFVYQLGLTGQHLPSSPYSKNYSKDASSPVVIHYCYILKDNGMWSPTRILKVGSSNRSVIDRFSAAVNRVIRGLPK